MSTPTPGNGNGSGSGQRRPSKFLSRSGIRSKRGLQPPPQRSDHLLPWLCLLGVLLVASLPLLIEAHLPEVKLRDEAAAVATSVQTWRAEEALTDDNVGLTPPTPRFNGEPIVDRPPGVTWLHLAAFTGLDRETAKIDDLVWRARLSTAAASLLLVASVFWIGMSVGGLLTAMLSASVCISLPVLLFQGRFASPAMPELAAAVFATAAALWAARPLKPPASAVRQGIGWILCGLALGATLLLGGLAIMPKVLIPLAAMLAVCPRRVGYLLALASACAMAGLIATPWALDVHEYEPEAWRSWIGELVPQLWFEPGRWVRWQGGELAWLLLATAPWTLWLFGALGQPFSTSSKAVRPRMLMGWVWFVSHLVLLLLLPPGRDFAQAMLVLPPAAFLIGQVFRHYTDLSAEGRHARFWNVARFPQLVVLLVASIVIPMAMASQRELVNERLLSGPAAIPMGWMYWAGLSLALVGITALSMRFALAHHPARAAGCWAAWILVAWTVLAIPISRGPMARSPIRSDAMALAQYVQTEPIVFVTPGVQEAAPADPDPALLLYADMTRPVPVLTPDQAHQLTQDGQMFYVLTPGRRSPGPTWQPVLSLKASGQLLWRTLEGRSIAQPEPEERWARP